MKRILTIQDISCLGKCSITIALPLLSCMGVETVILPTALLSTHTMFSGFTCLDLSSQILPVTRHWKNEGIRFDAIYTGYLGSEEEIDLVMEIIRDFGGDDTLILVDPVMGDNGKLYAAFDEHYAEKNRELCAAADVIVPNITEACLMTGMPYKTSYTIEYPEEILSRLSGLGCPTCILTGVSLSEGNTGVMGYDSGKGEYFSYQNEQVPATYHGTGDIFSSVFAGALLNGLSWQDSLKLAADYTAHTIRATLGDPKKPWYGVNFEATIPDLIQALQKYR